MNSEKLEFNILYGIETRKKQVYEQSVHVTELSL